MKRGFLTLMAAAGMLLGGCLSKGEFTYDGDPVDPRCFLYGQETGSVALEACSGQTMRNADYPVEGELVNDPDRGIGYNFKCEAGPNEQCDGGSSFYKVLGNLDDDFFVRIEISGGGTGRFSQIRRVRLDNGILRTQELLAGGDRCNGGISKAGMKNGSIIYSQFLTPFDLIELSGGNRDTRFKAYDDIQNCASCCVAEADYLNGKLEGITLLQDPAEVPDDLDAKNQCFFNSYAQSYKQLGMSLDLSKVLAFGQKFSEQCAVLNNH